MNRYEFESLVSDYIEGELSFNKRKEFNNINKELLADKIAIAVVEKCGYPINLSGEQGILEFKTYYLSKDQESSWIKLIK